MDDINEKPLRTLLSRIIERPALFFDVEVVEHCNLNCKGCGSFAPIAKKEFVDLGEYRSDMERLSELSGGGVHHINILGGEPLLHPQINELMRTAREFFPIGGINLITNGILLQSVSQEFWDICRESRITVAPTKYPIQIDWKKIEDEAEKNKVKIRYFGNVALYGWNYYPIELDGNRNELHSFLHCRCANDCSILTHGKLYPCPIIPKIKYFNEAFGTDIPVCENDFLDIYKVSGLKEILHFFARPVPFCRFCNPFMHQKQEWGISERKMEEWT